MHYFIVLSEPTSTRTQAKSSPNIKLFLFVEQKQKNKITVWKNILVHLVGSLQTTNTVALAKFVACCQY
jgi:hypothetical protein